MSGMLTSKKLIGKLARNWVNEWISEWGRILAEATLKIDYILDVSVLSVELRRLSSIIHHWRHIF